MTRFYLVCSMCFPMQYCETSKNAVLQESFCSFMFTSVARPGGDVGSGSGCTFGGAQDSAGWALNIAQLPQLQPVPCFFHQSEVEINAPRWHARAPYWLKFPMTDAEVSTIPKATAPPPPSGAAVFKAGDWAPHCHYEWWVIYINWFKLILWYFKWN